MFIPTFYVLGVVCALLYFYTRNRSAVASSPAFSAFQRTYLIGYLLAAEGDWLQGAHVYALYVSYKLSKHDIELLFVAGFGSSVLFGTIVGSVADKLGRRNNCLLYGILYGAACITKHFSNFYILMIGRLFGGIATSIFFSAFESWLVFEHNKRGFTSDLLSLLFSNATLGNSLAAIIAGVVAQFAADTFGYVAPFDVSLTVLLIMSAFIASMWPENYGDAKAHIGESFREAWKSLKEDRKILWLGIIQSLFEGSMYTFVLEWTPALTPRSKHDHLIVEGVVNATLANLNLSSTPEPSIPHGYIFASFMVAVMIGSSLFRLFSSHLRPESFMRIVLIVAAFSLLPPVIAPDSYWLVYGGFITFEICVGLFWPSMGFLRGLYVAENARSTVMNFFRVPLNLIVIIILIQNLSMIVIFSCCVGFLLLASLAQCALCQEAARIHFSSVFNRSGLEKSNNNVEVGGQEQGAIK